MPWTIRVADDAQSFIESLPEKARRQVWRSVSQLEEDPFRGDVQPLKGKEWKGYYRKRVGDYRIIFFLHDEQRIIDVAWVLRRSEKTYR
ncbi:MAG TPA: type II toxin-antitoxin system RelE/ParE family toxin [Terriglobia bacterium]|nr:type II toxin-antitoxin system RelE/ParE family toxin [Terriglobia bacterium]